VSSCSTRSNLSGKYPVKNRTKITTIKFIPQEEHQCGPAALSMMFSHIGETAEASKLSSMVFTPDKKGSFQTDMISAVRRHKLLPLPVKNLQNLLTELDAGHPVLVLQNLGLSWIPRWHYAVAVGYDLKKSQIILHSGTESYSRLGIYTFEKTWARSNNWGLLVVRPGTVNTSVSAVDTVSAIAHLEAMGFEEEAKKGYESVLVKEPINLGALIGLGNIYFSRMDFKKSVGVLKAATFHHNSAEAWHNYALALQSNRDLESAKEAAAKAIELCDKNFLPKFKENLSQLIK
jgi:tetratricopeptide (TPR) repeat protein